MDPTNNLHFSFDPVQAFVAQARRTRDLWAGSYLLSYLAGCAMKALEDESRSKGYKDKVIVFPDVARDPLYQAIAGGKKPGKDDIAAQVGSLPNRFKAKVPEDVDGKVCVKAITGKWADIANEVRTQLDAVLNPASLGKIDDRIWDRQIDHHWDCAWVISNDDSALDIRKNLRNHHTPPEKGEKCTVCSERQELSGKGLGTKESRDAMRDWWNDLRTQLRTIKRATLFDLKQGERLCAVCLVKRAFVFPSIAEQKQVIGWRVPVNYPSTSYMAAVDWIIRVFEACKNEEKADEVKAKVKSFVNAAKKADVWDSEAATRIHGITQAGQNSGLGQDWKDFADLDGGAFFESVIRNDKEFEVAGTDETEQKANRQALTDALKALQDALQPKSGDSRKATPFYALLLMDGDNMGKLLSVYKDKQGDISAALAQFSQAVRGIVRDHNGRLIYAGGDDVFALLPLDKAIECAKNCRDTYKKVFDDRFKTERKTNPEGVPKEKETTISAAIEYAHMQTALGVVVKDAHRLLDRVAKDGCGRDGLASRVWKRGGPVLTWAQPWKLVVGEPPLPAVGSGKATLVDEVCHLFQDKESDRARFSSKFFYKMRNLFELLAPNGAFAPEIDIDTATKILVTEYLANRAQSWPDNRSQEEKRKMAEERVRRLLDLCHQQKRGDDGSLDPAPHGLSADGALLIRFLVQKEV